MLRKKFMLDFLVLLPALGLLVFMVTFLMYWQSIVLGVPSAGYYWLTPLSRFMMIASGIIWLWMLVDCLRQKSTDESKILWAAIIILGSWIGALLYYFIIKRKTLEGKSR